MTRTRKRMPRSLLNSSDSQAQGYTYAFENSKYVRNTEICFAKTNLPSDVYRLFAEAFWSHFGINPDNSIIVAWANFRIFLRFTIESGEISSVRDLDSSLLRNYVVWLNAQTKSDGVQWKKSSRYGAYAVLKSLLSWTERCRPGILSKIEYPINPFPWRNRDTPAMERISATKLREILRACEKEVSELRVNRLKAERCQSEEGKKVGSLGWLLKQVNDEFGGVFPDPSQVSKTRKRALQAVIAAHGGLVALEPLLYPRSASLLPYYLLILIHAAANPEPIAKLDRDCIHSIPLLTDRKALVWLKPRAQSMQRRSFDANDKFEPPALVADLLSWNARLVKSAGLEIKNDLFVYKGLRGVTTLTCAQAKVLVKAFCKRHSLGHFSLASIRPSVLTSFYRVTGDLRRVKNIANHAYLSTTVRYVEAPEVKAQNRSRIADLQDAFVDRIQQPAVEALLPKSKLQEPLTQSAVSMFGFDCRDPFSGVAPGSQRGRMCAQFMGCFTCPNAVIPPDPSTLARLLQTRDHFRSAMRVMHPARWNAIYAPQLKILELDILPRFSERDLANASLLISQLPLLPELR